MLQWRPTWALCLTALVIGWLPASSAADEPGKIDKQIEFSSNHSQEIELDSGQTVEISTGVQLPSKLPDNGRLAVVIPFARAGGYRGA